MSYFHGKNPVEFGIKVWHYAPTGFHVYIYGMHQYAQTKIRRGSPNYWTHNACHIHGETDVTNWHG